LRGGGGAGLDDSLATTTKRHLRRPFHHAAPQPTLRVGVLLRKERRPKAAYAPSPTFAGEDELPRPRAAFFASEPSNRSFYHPPLTNAGPFLCFPSPLTQKEAERRQAWVATSAPAGCGGGRTRPPRLSASHRGSRQGDLRHPRRSPGHVSWDAVWQVLPAFACPSPASTSRAGRNAGRHDAQAARERGVSSRPRAPHSLRLPEYLRERRP
jgi:hypothetical protein